ARLASAIGTAQQHNTSGKVQRMHDLLHQKPALATHEENIAGTIAEWLPLKPQSLDKFVHGLIGDLIHLKVFSLCRGPQMYMPLKRAPRQYTLRAVRVENRKLPPPRQSIAATPAAAGRPTLSCQPPSDRETEPLSSLWAAATAASRYPVHRRPPAHQLRATNPDAQTDPPPSACRRRPPRRATRLNSSHVKIS